MDYVFDRGWEREPYSYLNPWGDRSMLAGSGTIGMEILDELPELAAVYIPVGGGGLVAAIGSVIKELRPGVEVVGVQSTACPSLGAALEAGKPTWVQAAETICDGTSVPVVVDEMYPLVSSVVDRVVQVSEDDVREAIANLALGNKLVVGGLRCHVVGGGPRRPEERSRCLHHQWREHRGRPAGNDTHRLSPAMITVPDRAGDRQKHQR